MAVRNNPDYMKDYMREYRKKYPNKVKEWEAANVDRRREQKRRSYHKRKESGAIAAYREANGDTIKAYMSAYHRQYRQIGRKKTEGPKE